jgi:molecular chaperone DnaK
MLAEGLGISLDYSVDPLTVVARGAAVFAGAQRLDVHVAAPAAVGEYQLELAKAFRPVGLDSAPMVGGKVSGASAQDFTGFTLELVNTKTQWRSGKVSMRPDGVFVTNLHAEKDERNTFAIELHDASGRKQKITPDTLTYTISTPPPEQLLINSIGIAFANNENKKGLEQGKGLPQKVTLDCVTTASLRQGRSEDVCRIPLVEGENDKADRNRFNGALEIRGDMIRRDLPAGSDVEVTVKIDESRILTVTAYVPVLDEEFAAKIEMMRHQPNPDQLTKDYEAEMKRFREVKSKAAATGGETAERLVEEVEASPLAQDVKELLAAAKADPTAAIQCEMRLLDWKRKLDEAADALEWPTLKKDAHDCLGWLRQVADQHGSEEQKQKTEDFAVQVEEFIREYKPDRLRKKIEEMVRLCWQIQMAQPGWWVREFQRLEKLQHKMTDQSRAARLFDQGRECIAKNNFTGLQNVVRQLWELLPDDKDNGGPRAYGGNIMPK